MHYLLYSGGEWKPAHNGGTLPVVNPATEEEIGVIAYGNENDAAQAVEAAHHAFAGWRKTNPFERSKLLKNAAALMRAQADECARATTQESGKPLVEAKGEWLVAADLFEWFAEEAKRTYGQVIPASRNDKRMSVIWQPIGVVGIITAWNFPVWNLGRAWAAALAAGCTIIAKPSEFTPISAVLLTQFLEKAGFPKGAVNLINGDAASIADCFLKDERVRKIHFVGSTRVGKLLMDKASLTNTKLSLELGGNAPLIVFPDADPVKIAAEAARAKFRNCGQVCVSPQRFIIHEAIYDRFVSEFSGHVEKLSVGNGLDPATQVGPLINRKQRDYVAELVTHDLAHGAELVTGGSIPSQKGFFYTPTVLKKINSSHVTFTNEIFGPVVPMLSFSTTEEALALANQTEYGLVAYLFTNHLKTATLVAEALEFGIVGINEWAAHATEAPFGGWKQSGIGSELGPAGIFEYMEKKLISIGGL